MVGGCPSKPLGAAQGRVAAAPAFRRPHTGQGRRLGRPIDRLWRQGLAAGREGRSTPAAAGAQRQFVRGRDASLACPKVLVDAS